MMNIKPSLFLHIQKTAGSSIVHYARLSLSSDKVMSHGDYLKGGFRRGKLPGDFKDCTFVSGHFGFDFARQMSLQHQQYFLEQQHTEEQFRAFAETARQSLVEQKALEDADDIPFDEFLKRYFAQTL